MYIYNFFINFIQCLYILRFTIYKNEKINYDTIHDSHFNNYGYTVQPKKKNYGYIVLLYLNFNNNFATTKTISPLWRGFFFNILFYKIFV